MNLPGFKQLNSTDRSKGFHQSLKLNFFRVLVLPFYCFLTACPPSALSKNLSEFNSTSFTPKKLLPCRTKSCGTSRVQLNDLAKSLTVKVFSGNSWGSGTLLQKQGQIYTVVTNRHVLTQLNPPYLIQTPDGRIYEAQIPAKNLQFDGNDLAVLQFRSADAAYAVASLRSANTLLEGERVFAAGFPFGGPGFVLTSGWVSLLPEQALEQGYQIGYTNEIQKGMSGGPLLNSRGEVVGINGMHAYPLWGDPYVYRDGSLPTVAMRDLMVRSAFAIPIETLAQLAPQFASLPTDQSPPQGDVYSRRRFSQLLDLLGLMPSKSVAEGEFKKGDSSWQ